MSDLTLPYARAAAFYETTSAPSDENNAARQLILSIYRTIGECADELGLKPVADVYFKPRERQKGRENDVKAIRTPLAKIDEIMGQLYSFCRIAEITEHGLGVSKEDFTPKKLFKSILAAVGAPITKNDKVELNCSRDCAESLKRLAEMAVTLNTDGTVNLSKSVFYFSRCVTDKNTSWLCDSFDYMLNANGEITKFCKMLEEKGFHQEVLLDGRYISLNYIKKCSKKNEPLKKAWADKYHLGIEISYEDLCISPATLHLRVVRFAELLKRASELTAPAKTLIQEHIKTCNECKYCVQTDKTGKRPLAAIMVEGVNKCPYFPSFSLRWTETNAELLEHIIAVLEAYKILELA